MWWARIAVVLCVYVFVFVGVLEREGAKEPRLEPVLPSVFYQIIGGYAQQVVAESLYIKAVVFLGTAPLPNVETYKDNLYQHFLTMQTLHPKFLDLYYLSESSLSWVSHADTLRVNHIMSIGMHKKTSEWMLYFFKGFNEFYYLEDPVLASKTLYESSNIQTSPAWMLQLATVLAAKGGQLKVGLRWLEVMLKSEDDPQQIERYQKDIVSFQKAVLVQDALLYYHRLNKSWPNALEDLVPNYLKVLPVIKGDQYVLSYVNQELRLLRTK